MIFVIYILAFTERFDLTKIQTKYTEEPNGMFELSIWTNSITTNLMKDDWVWCDHLHWEQNIEVKATAYVKGRRLLTWSSRGR